jgi:exopolyphosphatase / guanosine-5'-triphosphate,3'-diphosphate pyrophosphatase
MKLYYSSLAFLFLTFSSFTVCAPERSSVQGPLQLESVVTIRAPSHVVRAAIDIGSGATKLRVAEVDKTTNKIVKILANISYPTHYQEHLEKSATKTFDNEIMKQGLHAIKASKEIAQNYHADQVVAVATAAFRNAANSQEFMNEIWDETGVKVYVIEQELEGKLAFEAASAQFNGDLSDLIVWDIGGGSLQLTMLDPYARGELKVFLGHQASVYFKNHMIEEIQNKSRDNASTPNPMTLEQIQKGVSDARWTAESVDQIFKAKIQNPKTTIIGVGNIFASGIHPHFTQQELSDALMLLAGKTDEEVGGGPFANVAVTNAIMVLGFMQALGIQEMQIKDINNADGAILYPEFWE